MTPSPIFRLQNARYGVNWEDEDSYGPPEDPSDLASWIQIGDNCECYDGKYHYRIVDEMDIVYWTKTPAYENVKLDLASPPQQWLDSIRRDYAINNKMFAQACHEWLEKYEVQSE